MNYVVTSTPFHRLQYVKSTGLFALRAGGLLVNLDKGNLVPLRCNKKTVRLVERDIYQVLEDANLVDREVYFRTLNGRLFTQRGSAYGFTQQGTAYGSADISLKLRKGGFKAVSDVVKFTQAYLPLKEGETVEDIRNLLGNTGLVSGSYIVRGKSFVTIYSASPDELDKAMKVWVGAPRKV